MLGSQLKNNQNLPMNNYDSIIVSSGQARTPLSKKLAKIDWKTALIEKENIGCTCLNVRCTQQISGLPVARPLYAETLNNLFMQLGKND